MTHAAKYRQNRRLLKGYVAYLDECTSYDERLKICTEIGRLQTQNEAIKQMKVEDYEQDTHDYSIAVPSTINRLPRSFLPRNDGANSPQFAIIRHNSH